MSRFVALVFALLLLSLSSSSLSAERNVSPEQVCTRFLTDEEVAAPELRAMSREIRDIVGQVEIGVLKQRLEARAKLGELSPSDRVLCLEWIDRIEKETNDRRYLSNRPLSLVAGSSKVALDGAYTNNAGSRTGPAIDVGVELDDRFVGNARLGWYDKPILRDAYLLGPGASLTRLEEYRSRKDFLKWGLLDAVKLSANCGYGSLVNDPEGDNNFTVDDGFVFDVRLTYAVSLDKLLRVNFEEK
jgi:hypothetical protein